MRLLQTNRQTVNS